MTGGVGVVTTNDRVPTTPTGLVARIVKVVTVKNVDCAIVSTPVLASMVTPALVVVYVHASVPVNDAVFVNVNG
jgi:hypothetical protein